MLRWYRRNRARSRALFDLLATMRTTASRSRCGIRSSSTKAICPASASTRSSRKGSAVRASMPGSKRCSPAASIRTRTRQPSGATTAAQRGPTARRGRSVCRRGRPAGARCARPRATSSSPGIRCSIAPRRSSRSSNTRRCTRKRCSTCGIGCRSSRSDAPPGYRPRVSGSPPSHEWIEVPGGLRDARRRTRIDSRSAGTTNSRRHRADVAAFAIERHDVTNDRFLEFVEGGRLSTSELVDAGGLGVGADRARRSSALLGARRTARGYGAAMFDLIPLPLVVAGVRQPRRGVGVRAVARRAAADRSRVPARRVRVAGGRAASSLGRRRADAGAGRVRFHELGSRARRQSSGRRERVGRRRSRRQRLGVDEHDVRAVSRLPRDGVVSGVLGRFLRRRAFRHERRVAGDRARAAAADVPQLVPTAVSVCLCDLSLRQERRQPASNVKAVCRATSPTT